MTEKPILFSAPMVRAILAGEKTQTRRVVKDQSLSLVWDAKRLTATWPPSPYGVAGDQLWVRETFRVGAWRESGGLVALDYRASPEANRTPWLDAGEAFTKIWQESTDDAAEAITAGRGSACRTNGGEDFKWDRGDSPCRWRPSIFMPRWASRITLEVTDVRVERLQKITRDDAISEGVSQFFEWALDPVRKYRELWNSLNAKRGFSWDKNPDVWVVCFRRITP